MKRTIALGAVWTASAAAAVGLGFLAVSLVDASAAPGTSSAAATTSASTTPGTPSDTSVPPSSGEYPTVAGTVYADCTGGSPVLAGAPATGWSVDDSNGPGVIEFRSATQKLEVRVSCLGGSPQFSDEGLRGDGSGRGSGSSSSIAVTPSAGLSADDSSGRSGGGHGADG